MKIKRFKAKTFAEALEAVKKELGQEAVILSSEEKRGLSPYVEVTAAVDYDESATFGEVFKKEFKRQEVTADTQPPALSVPSLEDIKKEIETIKRSLEEMRFSGFEIKLPDKKRKVFHLLRDRGIQEEFALRLCEKVKEPEGIIDLIKADINIKIGKGSQRFDLCPRRAIMMVGPTGVGKTTTIAKLAALAVREKKRAAIINLDAYRIGAPEQIRIYARILGIPLHRASNLKELREGLERFSADRELVFIDTTGRNPRDEGYINELSLICSDIGKDKEISERLPLETHLLINTNSDSGFMIEAYRYYSRLPLTYIALTKIDEAVRFGNIYNMIMTYEKPVAYITTGQKVPDDIEFPQEDRVANLILGKGEVINGR